MTTTKQSRLVSIPKSDLDSLLAAIETLENRYAMKQFRKSENDIRKGSVRNARVFL